MNLKLQDILPQAFFNDSIFGFANTLKKIVEVWDEEIFEGTESFYSKVKNFIANFDFIQTSIVNILFDYYFGNYREFALLGEAERGQVLSDQRKFLVFLPYIRALKGTVAGVTEFMTFLKVYDYVFEPLLVCEVKIGKKLKANSGGERNITIGEFTIGQPLIYSDDYSSYSNNFYKGYYYRLLIVSREYVITESGIREISYPITPANFSASWLNFIVKFLLDKILPFYIDIIEWFVGDVLIKVLTRINFSDSLLFDLRRGIVGLLTVFDICLQELYKRSSFNIGDYMGVARISLSNRIVLVSIVEIGERIISEAFGLLDTFALFCSYTERIGLVSSVLAYYPYSFNVSVSFLDKQDLQYSFNNTISLYSYISWNY